MTTVIPQCMNCKHFDESNEESNTCKAFKLGIPDVILLGRVDHRKAYPGDNGVRFESKEAE